MKVFGTDRQWLLQESIEAFSQPSVQTLLMRPDSSVVNSGKHLYPLPHLTQLSAYPVVAYKVAKVGKFVPLRFAHRYISQVAVGIAVADLPQLRDSIQHGYDPTPFIGFDGALVLDNFSALPQEKGAIHFLSPQGKVEVCPPPLELIYRWISFLSELYLLKMGDLLLFPGCTTTQTIALGDNFYVSQNNMELAYLGIR